VQIGELTHLAVEEGAPFTLPLGGSAVVPHVEVHEQLGPTLERLQERHRPIAPHERDRAVDLDHGQPAPRGGDRVALAGVCLLPHEEGVELRLPRDPVEDGGRWGGVEDVHVRHLEVVQAWLHGVLRSAAIACGPCVRIAVGVKTHRQRRSDSMCAMSAVAPKRSQWLAAVSGLLLGLVVAAGVLVGVYALRDPNNVQFGAPWPLAAELVAAVVAGSLAVGVHEQRRRTRPGLFAFEIVAALVALLMLGAVAFALSFNQA
jgi:hypothetical protein